MYVVAEGLCLFTSPCLGTSTGSCRVTGPALLELVKLYANMPTEEFLALLVKSKAAGASTVIPSVKLESGPEAISKSLVSPSSVIEVDAVGTAVVKDKERKRHREGHFSKGHHSKKLKDVVELPSSDGNVGALVSPKGGTNVVRGLRGCKDLVDQLSTEMEKLLKLDDLVDVLEVKRLRGEVSELKVANKGLEETSQNLVKENTIAADKLFASLTEKSHLITECDALSDQVKNLQLDNQTLKDAVKTSEECLAKKMDVWMEEKAALMTKMEGLSVQLAKCQAESLSSFEEGYNESVGRLAKAGVDVVDHSFDRYLADVAKGGEAGKTGSSNSAPQS